MVTPKKAQKKLDVIVVGAGLGGLALAYAAQKAGHQVALLETQSQVGGFHQGVLSQHGTHDSTLHHIPNSSDCRALFESIKIHLDFDLVQSQTTTHHVTFEDGKLKPFTGFGKEAPEFYSELSPYLEEQQLVLKAPLHAWVQQLKEALGTHLWTQHLASELVVENGKARGVIVNGHHFWEADSVIFAGSLIDLHSFLPADLLTARLKNHLKRPKQWTIVAVDFYHPEPLTESQDLHILNGTTQDDIGPCLGRFHTPFVSPSIDPPLTSAINPALTSADSFAVTSSISSSVSSSANAAGVQLSQWLSFARDEDADESELIAAIIKKIKKQIKRAYPSAFEQATLERIVVIPSGAGALEDAQIQKGYLLKGVDHFYLACSLLHPLSGPCKPLAQAQRVWENSAIFKALAQPGPLQPDASAPSEETPPPPPSA